MKKHSSSIVHLSLALFITLGIQLGCGQADTTASAEPAAQSSGGTETSTSAEVARSTLPFHGTFHTTYQGTQSILRLEQDGQNVNGKIDLAILSGKADGNTARGEVKHPETNQTGGTFVMTRKGDHLDFQLTLKDPDSGETLPLPAFTYSKGQPPPPASNIDPALVGRWRHTSTYASGGFTAATDIWLILNPDGTYEHGYAKSGAGGAAGSIVTDRGDADRGKWRVQDRMLQYQEQGTPHWETFARYYVEGDTMMLTYTDGSKKIWYRQ